MNNQALEWICYGWIGIAILIHVVLFYIKAPFGRHTSTNWGPSMNNKWGWCIMELPSLLIMAYFLFYGAHSLKGYTWILFACWIVHYTHRSIIYPLRIKATDKKIPVAIVCSAIIFNLVNAGLNGYQLGQVPTRSDEIVDMRLSAGAAIFLAGLFINLRSDSILIGLRGKGEKGYKIPHGFLFRYISTPNLFGEILEWAGFAMMAWNLPAFTFLIWTYANLVPRAKNHHEWYLRQFPDYPKDRKIIFPFIY